jgi:hypothetical protein
MIPTAKKKGKWYSRADNQSAAQIAKEKPLHGKNERNTEHHVVKDSAGRNLD